jgi:flagellar biosynthetic protein FliQ
MTQDYVITLMQNAFWTTLLVSAPILGLTLIVGVIISIFQAVTQVHEMTLTFIPKMLATAAALLLFGSWMLGTLVTYTRDVFTSLPMLVK